MAATVQHASNRGLANETNVFQHEANNVDAIKSARLQKQRMEDAKRAEKQLSLDLEGSKKDNEGLKDEITSKDNQINSYKSDIATLQNKIEASKNETAEIRKQKEEAERLLNSQIAKVGQQLDGVEDYNKKLRDMYREKENEVSEKVRELQRERENTERLKRMVPNDRQDNCLPFQYHDSTVMIVHLMCQMAIDAGKDNGAKCLSWQYDRQSPNWNQVYKLAKVNNDPNPDTPWYILHRSDWNRKLYFPAAGPGWEIQLGNAPDRRDQWFIGRGAYAGSWLLKNAGTGTLIEMESINRNNGTVIKAYDPSTRADAHWLITPYDPLPN